MFVHPHYSPDILFQYSLLKKYSDISIKLKVISRAAFGDPASEIAEEFSFSDRWIKELVRRFNLEGIKGLYDKPRSGRMHQVYC